MNTDNSGNLCLYTSATATGRPGWVEHFESQLKDHPSAKSYPFASVDPTTGAPKVRYVVHRSLTPASSILLFTSDTRMNKISHLESQPLAEGSFWIEETGVQFRVAGKAYVVPSDADSSALGKEKAGDVVRALRAQGDEASVDWWIAEREKSWGEGISGHLRATFARPTPGTPLNRVERKPDEWTETIKPTGETDEQKKEIARAKANFTLVALAPETVEMLELKVVPNRRTVWTRRQGEGENGWDVQAVVP
ncbi:hypothetical protein NCC49_005522 [Naganishia albida]|nr:hypothetical protein NCC49_005522 [Naganishia albida]